jgi:hypothetical protein
MRILHTAIGLTKSGGNFDDQATAESGHDHGKVDNNVLRTTDRDLSSADQSDGCHQRICQLLALIILCERG